MSVGFSGALTIPEIRASAALSHTAKTQVGKAEDLPETALRGRYDAVDYTEEVTKRLGIKRSEDGAIQGVFDPESGKSYLIASNLTPETAPVVLVHEVGVHMATDGSGRAAIEPLIARAAQIVIDGASNGDATAQLKSYSNKLSY